MINLKILHCNQLYFAKLSGLYTQLIVTVLLLMNPSFKTVVYLAKPTGMNLI